MRRSNDGMRCTKVGMLHLFLAMRCPFLAVHRPFLTMRRPLRPMQRPLPAMLHAFVATRCEGEDASDEESRGHHALHGVPYPSRG
jgi:hypothetical protein